LLVKNLNNINNLDSWFIQSGIKKAQYLYKSNPDKKVIFSGKYNYLKRLQGKITKE